MTISFPPTICRARKRWRAVALQDAGGGTSAPISRGAFWTAPVLWRFWLVSLLLVLVSAGKSFAVSTTPDFNTDFSTANKFYAEGKFTAAASLYEKILQGGAASPALLFNYGNAEFKAGHLGAAIAAYRRAELLAPRDPDIRANLAFVRTQVQGATRPESRWRHWLGQLTLNEWALLAAAGFWLTLLSLTAKQIRPALAPRLRRPTIAFMLLLVFSGAALGVQAAERFSKASAVVIADEATARSGPFDDAQDAFKVRDGAELSVLNRHDDWVQVADGAGNIGWLETKQVEILPGA
jgi:tetratricopeptide (TPR) repeat protein